MRLRTSRPLAVILLGTLAVGCGTQTVATHAANSAGTPSDGKSAVTGQQLSGATRQRAMANARAILGEFVPPSDAVRLAKPPRLPSGSPTMGLTSTTRVDAVGYWRAGGAPADLQVWEEAHASRSFSKKDVIVGPPSWSTLYSLPAVPGLLPTREMNVQFYDVGRGVTVIMADAMVSWEPPRPAGEKVPDTVTAVTIAPDWVMPKAPAPVTITSVPTVRRLAALVNGFPVSTASATGPCPSPGSGLRLTFRGATGPLAVVTGPHSCGGLSVWLNGKDQPDLRPPSSYWTAVMTISGLRWKTP